MASGQIEDVVTNHKYDDNAPTWMQIAIGELGQKETDPYSRVKNYFEICKVVPDPRGTPWCRYFVNYCLLKANWSVPLDGMARGLKSWGNEIDKDKAQVGDLVILWRGTHDDGVTGHVGFYIKEDAQYIYLLGGNQGDAVTEAKFDKRKVLYIRRPRSMWKSKTSWAGGGVSTGGIGTLVDGLNAPTVEQAVEAKGLFEQVMQYFPNWKTMLGATILILGLYIIYNRKKDNTEKGV